MVYSTVVFFSPFLYNSYPTKNPCSISPNVGVGGLIILTLLAVFCLLNRRKDGFDGNFDPTHVKGPRGGSKSLPKIDLGEHSLINGAEVDEDDGMGGRLGAGPGRGGIIAPYPFQLTPGSGNFVGGQQHQNQLQMQQMSRVAADGVLAAGCPNKKRAMRQQYHDVGHTPNQPISSRFVNFFFIIHQPTFEPK